MTDPKIAENSSDEELVRLTLENQEYFLYIINRYRAKLFNYIRRIANISHEDAEDLLQEIFFKAYRNLNDFDVELKFSSWIYSIARNHTISNHRKLQSRAEGHVAEIDDEGLRNIASDFDIERDLDIEYLRDNIYKVLDKLDEKYREVLILKFLEEKNYQEISDIIRKPTGTVGSLINRAKTEFKKELAKQKINI